MLLIGVTSALAAIAAILFTTLDQSGPMTAGSPRPVTFPPPDTSPPDTAWSPVGGATGSPGAPPPPVTTSTDGSSANPVFWRGTLTFVPQQRGVPGTYSLLSDPFTPVLDDDSLDLCVTSCQPPELRGAVDGLVAWQRKTNPTARQCTAQLEASAKKSIPIRRGQSACFSSEAGVGFLTLIATTPDVSANVIIWGD